MDRRSLWILCLGLAAAGPAACDSASEVRRVEAGGVSIGASLAPAAPVVGPNRLELELRDAAGRGLEGAALGVKVHMAAMGAMPPMGGAVEVRELGGGRYAADFELAMAGTWQLELEARPAGGAAARAEGSLIVGTAGLRLVALGETPEAESGAATAARTDAPVPGEFTLPAARLQEIGVRSVAAERRRVERSVRALGVVAADESALADVSLKVKGWVGSLAADAVGVRVERGQVLFTLYSPELYSAQEEYLQALRSQESARGTGAPDRADWRVRAAARRLALWDVSPGDLAAIAQRGEPLEELPIRSPASGFVVEKNLVVGSAVEPGARLLRIVPLDRVWLDAEVYESEAPLVAVGMPADVVLSYLPGRSFEGRVGYVYPMLSEGARTLRVRIVLANPELELRPGMWATVRLRAEAGERLVVPEDAVLHAGDRSFVFLDLGGGRYRPRQVELGLRAGEEVEVLAGLEAGQKVVASGTFLVAAESRLRAGLEQW
jgi:Cu(I)/Ag(I) efflux system membrane fusion protein